MARKSKRIVAPKAAPSKRAEPQPQMPTTAPETSAVHEQAPPHAQPTKILRLSEGSDFHGLYSTMWDGTAAVLPHFVRGRIDWVNAAVSIVRGLNRLLFVNHDHVDSVNQSDGTIAYEELGYDEIETLLGAQELLLDAIMNDLDDIRSIAQKRGSGVQPAESRP